MNVENLMNSMTIEYKLEILARFFYYIEQNKDIPFNEINSDERDLCYFVANTLQRIKLMSLLKH